MMQGLGADFIYPVKTQLLVYTFWAVFVAVSWTTEVYLVSQQRRRFMKKFGFEEGKSKIEVSDYRNSHQLKAESVPSTFT